ncbi:hypothetical protein [uncultured Erythrobacter sp.]|uniref:hypothetical protein n=1 Tax=uncultured Erythrobacter sp. TaxID=263913 RepID=UPI0026291C91|nr:hypothetical protein [uncultured Erythrobacter sp.]
MKPSQTPIALPTALSAALLLTACDTSDPITPVDPLPSSAPASSSPMLEGFAAECQTTFLQEGGAEELAEPFCECSAARIEEQGLGPLDLINPDTMLPIGEACMNTVLDAQDGAGDNAAE